jgi:hypothetical protein
LRCFSGSLSPFQLTKNKIKKETMSNLMTRPLIEAPTSDSNRKYETLGYVAAYDAILNCDYAFVAYKETDTNGDWRVRINSSQTAGAVFEQAAMRSKARETGAQGKPWFQWGYSFDPSAGDARNIQFRVHVKNGQPSEIEMFVQLRKFDGTPDTAQSVKFPWPA